VTIDGKPYVYNVFGDDPEADRVQIRSFPPLPKTVRVPVAA
jgi:hypothetical protein